MDDLLRKMAREFYGYGRWDAQYWFIGPEPGGDGNEERARAFSKLGNDGLCDCKEFHEEIREHRWHNERGEKVCLQPTWRRLMLLLMPSLNLGTDQATLRTYQAMDWGRRSGTTCLIELGGLSAKSFKSEIDRNSFREERIIGIKERLEKRMNHSDPHLKLVVMYGSGSKAAWKEICGYDFSKGAIVKKGTTIFAFEWSPTAPKQSDEEWNDLGARIAAQL